MRDRSFATKAGAGFSVVFFTSLLLLALSTRCEDCDGQTISASGTGDDSTTTLANQADSVADQNPLVIGPNPIGGLADDSLSLGELVAMGEALLPTVTLPPGETTASSEAGSSSTTGDGGSTTSDSAAGTTGSAPGTSGSAPGTSGSAPGTSGTSGTAGQSTGSSIVGNGSGTTVKVSTTAKPSTTSTTRATTTTAAAPVATVPVDPGGAPASGQVFYVSPTAGNDGNDGTSTGRPWKSLQGSMKRLKPGQTLLLMNGEYRELKQAGVAHYTMNVGGTAGNWIKIGAAPGHRPAIVASQGTGLLLHQPYVEVSGLTIKGQGFNQGNHWGVGISITDTHHVRVVGNSVSNMPVSGISATGSSNFQIIGNDVYNNSFWSPLQGSGISVWHSTNRGFGADSSGYHDRIVGNRVHGNENKVYSGHYSDKRITDGNGIIVDSNEETGYSGRTLIANNLIYDNGGRGVIVWRSDRVDIMFNTAYQNGQTNGIAGGAAELAAGRANDIKFANNVGWARSGLPAFIYDRVTSGNSYGNVLISDNPSGHASSNDLMHSGNPGFRNPTTNPGTADFRPTSGSVLKGTSKNAASFIGTDLVGTSRRSGTPDVGAFEAEAAAR